MNRMVTSLRSFLHKTTVRFMAFYLTLVLLPTLAFVLIYTQSLHQQALNEQRYERTNQFNQAALYLETALSETSLIADTVQTSTPLLTLLGSGFPSASDELFAYAAYIQPLLDSIYTVNPAVDDVYFYRIYPSYIGNNGLVHNLLSIDDFPYAYNAEQGHHTFLAPTPDSFHHRLDETPRGARYVSLHNIYSSDYTRVVAVLELQLHLDSLLQTTLPLTHLGQLYLGSGDTFYPIIADGDGCHLDVEHPAQSRPVATEAQLLLEDSFGPLTLMWLPPLSTGFSGASQSSMTIMLLMLIPVAVFFLYIIYYTRHISKFSRHIHESGHRVPKPYPGPARKDEFGDVVREYNAMTQTIQELIDSVKEAEQLKNAANYYAMSTQVSPHFMFNTLENIRMHIELEQYEDAQKMLFMLGRFIRYNISLREESRLQDEFVHIQHYISIYQYRVHHMLSLEVFCDEDVPDVHCPVRMLQPIVENCLKHGIKGIKDPLHVKVHAFRCEDGLCIDVGDDGVGLPPEEIAQLNERLKNPCPRTKNQADVHVGLDNVNARIKYYYGPAYGLSFHAAQPTGLVCRIHIGLEQDKSLQGGCAS